MAKVLHEARFKSQSSLIEAVIRTDTDFLIMEALEESQSSLIEAVIRTQCEAAYELWEKVSILSNRGGDSDLL